MSFKWIRVVVFVVLAQFASGVPAIEPGDDELPGATVWRESSYELPALPGEEDWLPFYVSASTENRFFVAGQSISVGADGVVRFALLVRTPSGVRNISFEGIRCETRERRLYATVRSDGGWSRARSSQWMRIRDEYANRYHAALFLDHFCPDGVIVSDAEQVRNALRRDARKW